ncbi:MAG TPA: hypothetical protein VFR36_01940 [Sphingomicrobium sp.]|nr:hypothetical protein [Sphingomicrobium sp.]
MKANYLFALNAAMSALLIATAPDARAQQGQVGFGHRQLPPPPASGHHGFVGFPGVWVVEREVIRIVEKPVPAPVPPAPAEPPPPPRKPYAIGENYGSLPGGCMKMIEEGASYYMCSGEWYRQVGSGSAVQYLAVKEP